MSIRVTVEDTDICDCDPDNPVNLAEPCGNPYPAMIGQRARSCLLPEGHEGAHRNNGDAWRELTAEEAASHG